MPLVECVLGPTTTTVGNTNYSFERDEHGRFVARVYDLHHFKCLVGLSPYREVEDLPAAAPAAETKPDTPAQQSPGGAGDPAGPATGTEQSGEGAGNTGDDQSGAGDTKSAPDDLQRISGIGPATAQGFNERGITAFAQIAELTDEQVAKLNEEMNLRNAIINNQWRDQAAILAAETKPATTG